MIRVILLILTFACLSCSGKLQGTTSNTNRIKFEKYKFSTVLPPEATYNINDSGMDFVSIDFFVKERQILYLYLGNHSQFGTKQLPENVKLTRKRVDDKQYKCYHWENQSGYNWECLLVRSEDGWPSELHFLAKNLSSTESQSINKIIYSTRFE